MPTYSNTTYTKSRADLERLAARPSYEAENEAYIRQLREAGVSDRVLSRLDPWIEDDRHLAADVQPEVILLIAGSGLTPRRQAKLFDWIVACEIERLDLVVKAIEVFRVNAIVIGNRWDQGCSSNELSRFRDQAPYYRSTPIDRRYGRLPLNPLERISAEQSGTLADWDVRFPPIVEPTSGNQLCHAIRGAGERQRSDAEQTVDSTKFAQRTAGPVRSFISRRSADPWGRIATATFLTEPREVAAHSSTSSEQCLDGDSEAGPLRGCARIQR